MESILEREERLERARLGLRTETDGSVTVTDSDGAREYFERHLPPRTPRIDGPLPSVQPQGRCRVSVCVCACVSVCVSVCGWPMVCRAVRG